ncbi:MAG: 16S rRNA (guanine(527)-N(7))-methyltransferase RsmG [Acidobacteriota bacterium]|nr:16S rRNA (guanine(527)-N(7))-methyltransferase RsmG [Acidobacteriota bacterium]
MDDYFLDSVLPGDLPNREAVIQGAARHLDLIIEANKYLNLTRITSPREAAIKHVLDSVTPWRLFATASHVLDAGTGAGFPGIPLALVLPNTRFTLAESIQKKARFVDTVLKDLQLPNVEITPRRAEELDADLITARALAPIPKALSLFRPALKRGARLVLYKGPDAEQEIAETGKMPYRVEIVMRYELPDGLGTRTVVQIAR